MHGRIEKMFFRMSGYKNKIKVQNQEGRSEQERGADAAHLTPVAASWPYFFCSW